MLSSVWCEGYLWRINTCGREGAEAGWDRGRSQLPSGSSESWPALQGASECLWPIRVVQAWAEIIGPLSPISISQWVWPALWMACFWWVVQADPVGPGDCLPTALWLSISMPTILFFRRKLWSKWSFRKMNFLSLPSTPVLSWFPCIFWISSSYLGISLYCEFWLSPEDAQQNPQTEEPLALYYQPLLLLGCRHLTWVLPARVWAPGKTWIWNWSVKNAGGAGNAHLMLVWLQRWLLISVELGVSGSLTGPSL